MRVWLLLAGDFAAPGVAVGAGDAVIAVDGGMRHAERLGVVPDVWLGDFDSADAALQARYAGVERREFPRDKDFTDLELALATARARYPQAALHIVGSGGDEADHAFANLWVAGAMSAGAMVFWQKRSVIVAGAGPFTLGFAAPFGGKVSLLALTPLTGVRCEGLRWALAGETLPPFVARAARNEMAAERAEIGWQSGVGLLFLPIFSKLFGL
ncbi:MAG: thiamine diphosphokinase [Cardiobacteriaceae bacterium]|nr:thiamine diphosphokinase [Cardiobacteriaceae bacterium]